MSRSLAHRGPDDEGYVLIGKTAVEARGAATIDARSDLPPIEGIDGAWKVALGHRRLTIIDTSTTGHQPMSWRNDRYWIVFNGEIYNYRELRAELERSGCVFRSRSDTEVILAGFTADGPDFLHRLNGMFAFAIHDRLEKTTWLVRDRFGIKPLVWLKENERLLFASEVKAIRAIRRLEPDQAALFHFLLSATMPRLPGTFYRDVSLLEPGHLLKIDAAGSVTKIRWYEPPASPDEFIEPDDGFAGALDRYRDLLTDSIRAHLVADIPVGFCLSGGLDSSAIVSLAAGKIGIARPRTFTAIFPGERTDESTWARLVVNDTAAEASWTTPDPHAAIDELDAMCVMHDEPITNSNLHAQWCLMRSVHESGHKVVLVGQGADELMGGYSGYMRYYLAQVKSERGPEAYCRELELARRKNSWEWLSEPDPLASAPSPGPPPLPVFTEAFFHHHHGHGRRETPSSTPSLNARLHETIFKCQLTDILQWEDKNSMAFSVEARVPFVEPRLIEFLVRQPGNFKIRDGWTKWPTRFGLIGILPDAIRERTDKLGYSTPAERWLPLQKKRLVAAIRDGREATAGCLDPDGIERNAVRASDRQNLERLFRAAAVTSFLGITARREASC